MQRREIQSVLQKIRSNCQYLSHIYHHIEAKNNIKFEKIEGKMLCPHSVAKIITQMTYLLYTCNILNVDIYLMTSPRYIQKKCLTKKYEAKLLFYLAIQQEYETHSLINCDYKQQFSFIKFEKFNQIIESLIEGIINSTQPYLYQTKNQQKTSQKSLKKFFDELKMNIQAQKINNNSIQIIKQLQKTSLFSKNSDLLKMYRNSLYYQIKKKQKAIEFLRETKQNFECRKQYDFQIINNSLFQFRQIDKFLHELVNLEVIYVNKSTNSDQRKQHDILIGQIFPPGEKNNPQRFVADFYTLEPVINMKNSYKKNQRNVYQIQYEPSRQKLLIRYVTNIQVSSQNCDEIPNWCGNISFWNSNISIQYIDIVRNPILCPYVKKYVCFKIIDVVNVNQFYLFNILLLVQNITICAKIYSDLLTNRLGKNCYGIISEYSKRVNHACTIFVDRARQFYQSI